MARPTSVDRLPAELRELIGKLRQDGVTIDAILGKLRELGADVSRSALGRHVKKMEVVGERLRRSRDVADALVNRLGDAPEDKTMQLNIELMHSVIFDLVAGGEDGEAVTFEAGDAMFLAKALDHLGRAQKSHADFVLKIRQEVAKEAAAAVDRVAKTKGLSAETVTALKAEFLGIAKRAA